MTEHCGIPIRTKSLQNKKKMENKKLRKILKERDLSLFETTLSENTSFLTGGLVNLIMNHGSLCFVKIIERRGIKVHLPMYIHNSIERGFTRVFHYQIGLFLKYLITTKQRKAIRHYLHEFVDGACKFNRDKIANLLINKYRAKLSSLKRYILTKSSGSVFHSVFYRRISRPDVVYDYQERRKHFFSITYVFLPKDVVKWMVRFIGFDIGSKIKSDR